MSSRFKLVVPALEPFYVTVMWGVRFAVNLLKEPGRVFSAPDAMRAPASSQDLQDISDIAFTPSNSRLVIVTETSVAVSFFSVPCFTTSTVVFFTVYAHPSTITKVPSSSDTEPVAAPPCFQVDKGATSVSSYFPLARLAVTLPLWVQDTFSVTAMSAMSV